MAPSTRRRGFGRFIAPLRLLAGSKLASVTVLTKGTNVVTVSLYVHDLASGSFGNSGNPLGSVTQVPPANGDLNVPVPANYIVVDIRRLQLFMNGFDSTTTVSGMRFTYYGPTPTAVQHCTPIRPTRVYD